MTVPRIKRTRAQRCALVLLLLLFLAWGEEAAAQSAMINVDIAAGSPRVRTNAPIQLMLNVTWNGSSIAEGYFDLVYYSGGRAIVFEVKSHDLVLTPGLQTIRLMLPATGSNAVFGRDEIALKFVTEDETYDLKRYPMILGTGARNLSICVVGDGNQRGKQLEEEILSNLGPHRLIALANQQRGLSTGRTHWDNNDVPERPLHLCTFDLMAITSEGLGRLRRKQLDAVFDWVRAGGSVCVLLGSDLDGHHVSFLNRLLTASETGPFMLDSDGQFNADVSTAVDGIWTSHVELGRAAIVDLAKVPTSVDELWGPSREMASFLWKLRQSYASRTLPISRVNFDKQVELTRGQASGQGAYNRMVWHPLPSMSQFIEGLVPDGVKLVPMNLVGLLLLAYLLMVGPLDYFVLGYFRKRRYTWILFPLLTIAMAILCVRVSAYYLSAKTSGKSLTIIDVGADGEVLRDSTFELVFLGRKTRITSEAANQLFAPMDQERLTLSAAYAYNYGYYGNPYPSSSTPIRYEGRLPAQFEVAQTIEQWRPQVNRSTRLLPGTKIEGFDWNQAHRVANAQGRQELKDLAQAKWPNASVFVLKGERKFALTSGVVFSDPTFDHDDHRYYMYQQMQPNQGPNAFLFSLCRRDPAGIFEFFSQLSPTGGDNFEDLTLLDTSDPSQALLVVAVTGEDNTTIYRRLFTDLGK